MRWSLLAARLLGAPGINGPSQAAPGTTVQVLVASGAPYVRVSFRGEVIQVAKVVNGVAEINIPSDAVQDETVFITDGMTPTPSGHQIDIQES